ncbi:hypothetical protein IKG07_01790 [Candidatus Saccharibacteria bacterium]|nr:hypothetical protein [Candidatus Saccharibacteria bacterium]
MIDIHSHILPGIDDGAADIDASVVLIRELSDNGVTDVIATPHYVDETNYVSNVAANTKLIKKLRTRLKKEKINIELHLGNEIYICPKILKLLADGEITALGASKYLLVELPMSGEYPGYMDAFMELQRAGYKVILAHPERYTAFFKDFDSIRELYDMGVLLQCNLGSFIGHYGKQPKKLVEKLAKNDMIFAVASDIHHPRGSKFMPAVMKRLSKFYGTFELEDILEKNPKKILA